MQNIFISFVVTPLTDEQAEDTLKNDEARMVERRIIPEDKFKIIAQILFMKTWLASHQIRKGFSQHLSTITTLVRCFKKYSISSGRDLKNLI